MDTSPELGRAVLDSLSAALAVLDATGEIVSTNRTWTDLAAECTSLVRNVSGDDYLKTLSGLAGSAAAQSALAGVDSVRARKREMFRFEYAASGKWYLFQVAPVPGLPGGMLVTQQDITPQKNAEAERHASEAKYRALVESIPAGTYVASLDEVSKTLYVSPQLMPMLGYSKDAWHSDARLWTRNVHPDDRERVQAALQHALQTGEPFSAVYRFVRQDGRIVWLRDEATVVRGEAGEPLFQQGVLFDVTESRWAEEALRDREARLRLLVEQLPAVIVATDLELKLTSALGAGLRALGLHSGEAPGTSLAEYFQIDSNDSPILAAYRRALHGKSNVGDLEWHGRLYHTWVEPLRDKDGAITGTIGMAFDITESRRAEQVAAQERDFSRSLIDSSLDGIIAFDRDCRFTVWNPAMEVFLGVPARQALGAAAFDLLPFLAPSGDDALFKQALLGNSVVARDRPYTLPSGRTGFFEGHYAPLRGPQGEVTGGLAVIRDTTERKSLEAQLRESQKIEAVGRLAGGVAHDFNNLLTAITGYGQILLRELEPDDPRRRSGEKILAAADRAAALTHQLLAFSRRQVLQPRVLDPGEVVRGLEELLRRIVGEDIAVETAIEPGVGHVRADPGQIEQVILNLAVNARDAMPRGGRLVLEATSSELQAGVVLGGVEVVAGSYVVLAVRDTGHGMDGATLERVFEPFFTTKATGTGLGLATVYGIVRQSGGHVTVDSAPGAGTSFRVYLPCCGESAAASAGSLARPEPARGASGGETVLLLEDEDEVRGLVRLILQKYGYTVLEAGGIDEALRVASSHRGAVHLVLTDVIMPGLSGRDIVERLLAVRPEARVLYMSGYTDDALGPHGGLAEGVPFLSKPFTREALARKVREVLDTPLVGGGA